VTADVRLDGLTTHAFPLASAGASDRTSRTSGQFHGVMTATTPLGSRRMTP
jgi:hypothetical protein